MRHGGDRIFEFGFAFGFGFCVLWAIALATMGVGLYEGKMREKTRGKGGKDEREAGMRYVGVK